MSKFRPFLLALSMIFAGSLGSLLAKEAKPAYVGAIVIDADNGEVLFEDKADTVSPPASMTKLMTFAVLHDRLANGNLTLATPVTVTAEDSKIGGTQVWLKQGESFPVEDLIYAMLIQSGNDTAYALARTAAGTPSVFVEWMNAKAHALGMTHTTFRTPHGLPPANRRVSEGDLTTPRDYAILSRYLLRETDVTKYTAVRERSFGEGRRPADRVIKMTNHNHLIEKVAGVDGLKTGFTNGAGYCLAASANRNGRRIIAVVMGSPDSKTRDLKVMELLERGYAARPPPATLPTVKTNQAGATKASSEIPSVNLNTAPSPQKASPAKEPEITFRVPTTPKKP